MHCVDNDSLRMLRLGGRTLAIHPASDTFSNADSIPQLAHTCRSAPADYCDRSCFSNQYANHADSVNRNADANSFSHSYVHSHRGSRNSHRYKHNHTDANCDDHNSKRAAAFRAGKHHDSFLQHKL